MTKKEQEIQEDLLDSVAGATVRLIEKIFLLESQVKELSSKVSLLIGDSK